MGMRTVLTLTTGRRERRVLPAVRESKGAFDCPCQHPRLVVSRSFVALVLTLPVALGLLGPSDQALGGSFLGDTWTWDGSNWTQRVPAISPAIRYGAGIAGDVATGDVVLFGATTEATSATPGSGMAPRGDEA
jgi:hypothetical protein